MSEQIRFSNNIENIFRIIGYNFEEESPKFLGGVKEILALLQTENRIYEKENKSYVKKDSNDLFEELKMLQLEIYGITLFKTDQGSVYIFDKQTGTSLRFQTKPEWDYYEIHEPSLNCFFMTKSGPKKEPEEGANVYESYGSNRTHVGHLVVDVA